MFHYITISERDNEKIKSKLLTINSSTHDIRNNSFAFINPSLTPDLILKQLIIKIYQIRLYYNQCINDNIFILLDTNNNSIQYLVEEVFTLLNIRIILLDDKSNFMKIISKRIEKDDFTNRLYTRSYCNDCSSNYYTIFKHLLFLSNEEQRMENYQKDNNINFNLENRVNDIMLSITLDDIIIKDGSMGNSRLLNKKSLDSIVDDWAFNCNIYNKLQLIQLGIHILSKKIGFTNIQYITSLVLLSEIYYHQDNKFHNFYHAIDVLQATHYLSSNWTNLESQSSGGQEEHVNNMTLLISALLHDSAHTGSNNNLVSQNKDLITQLHSSESPLERIHFKMLSHIIKDLISNRPNKEPKSQNQKNINNNNINKNNSNSSYINDDDNLIEKTFQFNISEKLILATDMQRHVEFIERLKNFDLENYKNNGNESNSVDNSLFKYKMIIKAADISNVTRPLEISAQWGVRIAQEFKSYGLLTAESNNKKIPCNTTNRQDDRIYNGMRLGELSVKDCVKLEPGVCKSQVFFIEVFARSFFISLRDKFISENGTLKQLVVNLEENYLFWQKCVEANEKKDTEN